MKKPDMSKLKPAKEKEPRGGSTAGKKVMAEKLEKAFKEGRVVDKSGSSVDKKGKRINNTLPSKKK